MQLEVLWYAVIGFSILFYTVLDGFDLGVGSLHLFAKTDEQRRLFLNAIGPVWDGNEVWIVVVIGALFAGFPSAYATVFSGFYSLLMFIIAGFMFRAAAIEFRSKQESRVWRKIWDAVFCISSITISFVLGLLLGNAVEGIELDASQDFVGTFSDFFRPYTLLVGFTSVSLFAMHGALYLSLKTEGEALAIVRRFLHPTVYLFLFCYLVTSLATFLFMPHMTDRILENPYLFAFPIFSFLAIINIPYQARKDNFGWAFASSSLSIASLLFLFSLGTFPVLVRSTISPETHSLDIYNTASSHPTLVNLLIVAGIGVPLVFAYMFWVYRIFRGKVKLEKSSY
jgi:cytochrome d ubiquinol oxidase subunit II